MVEKVKTRQFNFRELVEKTAGSQQPIPVYTFAKGGVRGKTFYENPNRPYGPKR